MREVRPKRKDRREHSVIRWPKGKWPLYLLCLLVTAGLVVGGMKMRRGLQPVESLRTQMIRVGHQVVQLSLREGLRASFASEEETAVDKLDDGKTMISGWVDLITESGMQDRQNFSVVVYKDPVNGWMGERVSVIPQM